MADRMQPTALNAVLRMDSPLGLYHTGVDVRKSYTLQRAQRSHAATTPKTINDPQMSFTQVAILKSESSQSVRMDLGGSSFLTNDNVLPTEADKSKIAHLITAAGAPFGMEGPIPSYAGIFDLFKRGVGPSSSHTNGPMNIAAHFITLPIVATYLETLDHGTIDTPCKSTRVTVELHGSLSLTGIGHGTDNAVLVGLKGLRSDEVDDAEIPRTRAIVDEVSALCVGECGRWIEFMYERDFVWINEEWSMHPNGMRMVLTDVVNGMERIVASEMYLSIGGGFFVTTEEYSRGEDGTHYDSKVFRPYPFQNGVDLMRLCEVNDLTIAELMYQNEIATGLTRAEVYDKIDKLIRVMFDCINKGCSTEGPLPMRGMRRNAREQFLLLKANRLRMCKNDPLACLDYASVYARAVNEENACGCTVVTAPTNGACGIVPAAMAYYWNFLQGSSKQGLRDFMATAAAIGSLIKRNASISGAEAGCQAEVGSAISMAAAALCAALGGSVPEVEFAAEMGMEHSLGLTCDPVGGLVVVPCIDRNALGVTKAIMCARIAFLGRDSQMVSLDSVIRTMFETGVDIQSKYRETSQGGLALLGGSSAPGQKILQAAYLPLPKGKTSCTACNCELDETPVAKEVATCGTANEMIDQTKEYQRKVVDALDAAEKALTYKLPGNLAVCDSCQDKHDQVSRIHSHLQDERGLPVAITCQIGGY
eukprot:GHVH01016005.1.p1 GENE.GHVH01016005.1~~GHVH01016005.1.p1  ORF type:complete len:705 (+),score=78.80 GHVH01016005.1:256-2370(+)